jgi:hypothetical protein
MGWLAAYVSMLNKAFSHVTTCWYSFSMPNGYIFKQLKELFSVDKIHSFVAVSAELTVVLCRKAFPFFYTLSALAHSCAVRPSPHSWSRRDYKCKYLIQQSSSPRSKVLTFQSPFLQSQYTLPLHSAFIQPPFGSCREGCHLPPVLWDVRLTSVTCASECRSSYDCYEETWQCLKTKF